MERRSFLKKGTTAAAVLSSGAFGLSAMNTKKDETILVEKYNYNLKYAPHLGMFKNHAGSDPIDQLNFMADQGFTAFEDNGMKGRSIGTLKNISPALIIFSANISTAFSSS